MLGGRGQEDTDERQLKQVRSTKLVILQIRKIGKFATYVYHNIQLETFVLGESYCEWVYNIVL